jgi:hypothetical protein
MAVAMADAGANACEPAAQRARVGSLTTADQQGRLFDAGRRYPARP